MFITLLRRDPHLNQVETESSQTLISKVNHGTTPAVDISFYWYALLCWYPMISYINNLLLISTWYQHPFFPPSHPLLPMSKQICTNKHMQQTGANKYVQLNICKQTWANKYVQINICKQAWANKYVQIKICKQTWANKYVQINICKQTWANKYVQLNVCKQT